MPFLIHHIYTSEFYNYDFSIVGPDRKKKRKSKGDFKLRFKKSFSALLEEEVFHAVIFSI